MKVVKLESSTFGAKGIVSTTKLTSLPPMTGTSHKPVTITGQVDDFDYDGDVVPIPIITHPADQSTTKNYDELDADDVFGHQPR